MATRIRGNNMPAARPHPNSSKATSNQDSTSSQKQTPNHLKSTNVSKQQSKRPTPGDTTTSHKPTYVRRSTFDDPSSTSTTQNTRVSFSSKSATTQRSTVPARKQSTSQYTRPASGVKKRFIYVKKQDIGTSTSTAATTKEQMRIPPEKVEVSDAHDVIQPEQNPKDQESPINEAKEEETKADVSVQVAKEPIGNENTKAENIDHKDVDLKNDSRQDITLDVKTEDVSQVPEETFNNVNQELPEASNINEIDSSTNKTHENVADNPTSEAEETNKEPEKTLVSDQKEAVGAESDEVHETKEKRETANHVAAKTQVVAKAKKESVVSNDVIEETASKLREQRKNKVKALAGAFETVISLQEQK
ncbi:uncharacterized protein [Henckelia pumila]|uniref:uncharacterized protein n=1 Tax=Henckelia pumila TaxID=405737 RepID=UPI003C6E9B0A